MIIDMQQVTVPERMEWLQSAIGPRPIALVSTISKKGQPNLSPFSFFNLFSVNPPVLIFSPARRVRDNSIKHTLDNVLEVPEAVVHVVSSSMAAQANLASADFPAEVNEFERAGFTQVPATLVRPPMVAESPVSMECRVLEIKALGKEAGAGNLVICEVLRMHIDQRVLNREKKIDPLLLDPVSRLGGSWWSKLDAQNLFRLEKP